MKQGPTPKRHRGRSNGRRPNYGQGHTLESSGPDVKVRGSAHQVCEKYQSLARDAVSSGDRVAAENYLQHAEHYFRISATAANNAATRNDGNRQNNQQQSGQQSGGESQDADTKPAEQAPQTPQAQQEEAPAPTRRSSGRRRSSNAKTEPAEDKTSDQDETPADGESAAA